MVAVESSELVAALEVVWRAIQDAHSDVPDVVVTVGAGSLGMPAGALKLGHFAADRWVAGSSPAMAELFVGGEGLALGSEAVLATLLHEATHGVAHVRGVKDTSRGGRYHNKRFAALGEELGLRVSQVPQIGWSGTELRAETVQRYADQLHELSAAITAHRYAEGYLPGMGPGGEDGGDDGDGEESSGAARRPKNGVVLICGCGRRIRCSTAVAASGPIRCGVCGQEFEQQ